MTNEVSKIEAARKAFTAYQRALVALQEAPPAPERGTAVMTKRYPSYSTERFKCGECARETEGKEWKFCAYCGAEIIRFDRDEDQEPKVTEVRVGGIHHTLKITQY